MEVEIDPMGARESRMVSGSDQNENESKHVNTFVAEPGETLPAPPSARQLGQPSQAGNELMNQHRCTPQRCRKKGGLSLDLW